MYSSKILFLYKYCTKLVKYLKSKYKLLNPMYYIRFNSVQYLLSRVDEDRGSLLNCTVYCSSTVGSVAL